MGNRITAAEPFSHLDDLYAVLDGLKIQRATLIGLSAGSEIALDAALDIRRPLRSAGTPVFAAPPEAQALVRRMVTENDRLWAVPREFLKRPGQTPVDRLETVRVPTLILIGENDQGQKAPAELLARRIPRARIVRVSDGGHLLNLTSPREFQEAVSAFLSR